MPSPALNRTWTHPIRSAPLQIIRARYKTPISERDNLHESLLKIIVYHNRAARIVSWRVARSMKPEPDNGGARLQPWQSLVDVFVQMDSWAPAS